MEQTNPTPSQAVLRAIGGQSVIARECDLSAATVSYWAKKGIPDGWVRYLRLAHPGEHWAAFDEAEAARQLAKEGA